MSAPLFSFFSSAMTSCCWFIFGSRLLELSLGSWTPEVSSRSLPIVDTPTYLTHTQLFHHAGFPLPVLTVFKDDQPLQFTDHVTMTWLDESCESHLTIKDATAKDAGQYRFDVANEHGTSSSTVMVLAGSAGAPSFDIMPKSFTCYAGETILLTTRVSGRLAKLSQYVLPFKIPSQVSVSDLQKLCPFFVTLRGVIQILLSVIMTKIRHLPASLYHLVMLDCVLQNAWTYIPIHTLLSVT